MQHWSFLLKFILSQVTYVHTPECMLQWVSCAIFCARLTMRIVTLSELGGDEVAAPPLPPSVAPPTRHSRLQSASTPRPKVLKRHEVVQWE